MLGGGGPVGVDRLDVPRVGLAAPADHEGLGGGPRLVHAVLRDRGEIAAAGGLGDERQRLHRHPGEVVTRLLGADVKQRAQPPGRGERRHRALHVHPDVAVVRGQLIRLGRREPWVEGVVDEQSPHVAVGHVAGELLDVHASVAERSALFVGFGDLGLERHNAFETWLEVGHQRLSPPGRGLLAGTQANWYVPLRPGLH